MSSNDLVKSVRKKQTKTNQKTNKQKTKKMEEKCTIVEIHKNAYFLLTTSLKR